MKFSFTKLFASWIDHGHKPASAKEQSALLDESRSALKSIIDRVESGEIKVADQIDIVAAQYEKIRPHVTPAKKPIFKRAAKPTPAPSTAPTAAAKPLPSPAPSPEPARPIAKTISAQEFLGEQVFMTREEWQKLDQNKRAEFFRSGGKLAP